MKRVVTSLLAASLLGLFGLQVNAANAVKGAEIFKQCAACHTMGAGAEGSGVCTWTDADGDTWYGPWAVNGMTPDRAALGTWNVSGGTGKFATATGGGTFTTLTNPDTGDSKLDVLGSVTLK